MKNVEVRESKIEGKGLFAICDIDKGREIDTGYVDNRIPMTMDDEEFEKFREECIAVGKKWDSITLKSGVHEVSVADRKNNPGNYGNHSCDPNTELNKKVSYSIRYIEAGEEVTSDYSKFSNKSWRMNCNCGSKKCRKIIKGSI